MSEAYTTYMLAREADAKALEALAKAKAYAYQTRQAARRAPKHAKGAWAGTVKAAEDRLAQAKRRADAAAQALQHAWGYYRAEQQEVKARRQAAKAAHQTYQAALKRAA